MSLNMAIIDCGLLPIQPEVILKTLLLTCCGYLRSIYTNYSKKIFLYFRRFWKKPVIPIVLWASKSKQHSDGVESFLKEFTHKYSQAQLYHIYDDHENVPVARNITD